VNTHLQKRVLTFGEFIAGVYDAWGKRRALGIVRLAAKMHLVEFRGRVRFVISEQLQALPKMGAFQKYYLCSPGS